MRPLILLLGLLVGCNVLHAVAGRTALDNKELGNRGLSLVLEDTFDGPFDTSKWNQDVTLWGGGNWEFQAYTNLAQNTFTRKGALHIKPTLTADKYGESFLTSGRWDMRAMYGTCTQSASYGCLREGKNGVLNPVMSGRITSKATIKYGKVEIVAKAPRGDWLWPALWMYPKSHTYGGWPRSGEIDMMESRGNRHYGNLGVEYMGTTLHWGTANVNRYTMTSKQTKSRIGTLADRFNKYTFYWTEAGMKLYLNDEKIVDFPTPSQGFFRWGNLPGANIWGNSKNAPFDHPFYLIINLAVGGTNGFFPDGVSNANYNKPWRNSDSNGPEKFWKSKNLWYPTWQGDDASFQIDSVRIWQLN
ncbi:beta-1,3-glucan-binding protein-like [Watersipora subatra]|uniref:beta-1,3-glucan-binding protein-like n=1 Tax=Watersipora subatra TaxID=2589382 RepID=UPI00355C9A00